ncbi:hypothetical protein WN51_02537 [Melipona quadrifasciata]|uniref:Uncharacterized protein n=1 Tax=Melipona quadrifasciata TaxID=166423 RepID=A0A0N0BDH9_9HYME|nr:hypothetical protein WN51_02537 [Melipona quadrifasciata]
MNTYRVCVYVCVCVRMWVGVSYITIGMLRYLEWFIYNNLLTRKDNFGVTA